MKSMTKSARFNKVMSLVLAMLMIVSMTTVFSVPTFADGATDYGFKIIDKTGTALKGALAVVKCGGLNYNAILTDGVGYLTADGDADLPAEITQVYLNGNAGHTDAENLFIKGGTTYPVTLRKGETAVFDFSKEKPTVNLSAEPTDWTNGDVVITATSDDAWTYKWNGDEAVTSNKFTANANGTYTVVAVDAMNRESEPATFDVTVIDKGLPTINNIEVDPTEWTNQAVKVTVTATDNESGIAGYKMDAGEWQISNEFFVEDNTVHTFYVKDNAGNVSEADDDCKATVKYETVPPVISDVTATFGGKDVAKGSVNWANNAVTFTVIATDEGGSGIAQYKMDDGAWQVTPEFVVSDSADHTFYVKDKAGNESQVENQSANYDATLPVISGVSAVADGKDVTKGSDNWTNKAVTFTVTATDEGGSGIAQYSMDNVTWQATGVFADVKTSAEITFYVKDGAGNVTEYKQSANYDAKDPVVEDVTVDPWNDVTDKPKATKDPVKFTVTATDTADETNASSGIVAYIKVLKNSAKPAADAEGWQTEALFTAEDCKTYDFYAKDAAGNVSNAISAAGLYDKKPATLNSVEFEQKNEGTIATALNKLTFGAFFNKTVEITVNAEDKYEGSIHAASGIASYKVSFYDGVKEDGEEAVLVLTSDNRNKKTFKIPQEFAEEFHGTIYVEVVDMVGNTTGEVLVVSSESTVENTVKSNIKDLPGNLFMIEVTAPVTTIKTDDVINVGTFDVDFEVVDGGDVVSGVNTVKVTVNGTVIFVDDLSAGTEVVASKQYTLTTDSIAKKMTVNGNEVDVSGVWADPLTVKIEAIDNAGNVAETVERNIRVDNTDAKITGFEFVTTSGNDVADIVEEDTFGFFFNDDTVKAVISATDTQEAGDTAVAGVASITYALVHVDGTVITKTENVTDDKIEVDIPALFKGQIYAYATDKVGNAPTVDAANNYDGYAHPYGTITETQTEHDAEKTDKAEELVEGTEDVLDHVKLELPETTFKTATDGLLYANDVPVKVTITDRQSSISKVEWKISTPAGDVSIGSVDVNDDTAETSEDTNKDSTVVGSWATVERDPALNPLGSKLVTQLSNTITVSKDLNCDGIVVYVKLTDRAGNVTEDTVTFGIDSEFPAIPTYSCVDGWYNAAIDYTVASTDNWSGIMAYGKSVAGGETVWTDAADAASFVYQIADQHIHTFYVKDRAGNVSEIAMSEHAKFDNTDPEITEVIPVLDPSNPVKLESNSWTNDTVYFVVSSKDEATNEVTTTANSGVAYYCMVDKGATVSDSDWMPVDNYVFSVNDFKGHDFYVKDVAGNASKVAFAEDAEMFDARDPELVDFVFTQENETALARAINFLTFGTFFKENVKIEVNTQDIADEINGASGVRKIDLIFKDEEGAVAQTYTHECMLGEELNDVFVIGAEDLRNFKGTVWAVISDHATTSDGVSNVTAEIQATTDNSNVGFMEFMIENDPTEILNVAPADKTIHKDDFALTFDVSDITDAHYAGIGAVEVKVNGVVAMLDDLSDGVEGAAVNAKDYSLAIDTKDKTIVNPVTELPVDLSANWNSGTLDVAITVVDNAGNVSTDTRTLYIDKNSPVIDGFEFSLDKNIDVEVNENELYKSINIDPIYGFYFKEAVTVTVTASDSIYTVEGDTTNSESIASGVATITYAYDGFDFAGNAVYESKTVAAVDGKISFTVPTGFKGQIYAYATDVVGNHPNDAEATFTDAENSITKADAEADARFANYIGWSRPNGQVIETQAQHDAQLEHITFAVPETKYTQNNNIPLYNKDVPVTVTVKDLYSGIAKVEWSVVGEHDAANDQSGVVNINNELTLDDTSWTVVNTEDNLVTEIQKTITVTNNCNDIKINVKVTDRAGNVSETTAAGTYKTLVFGIDKTIPTIDITYDNNTPDDQYKDIYNKDRTATIVITERNFRAKDVVFKITSTDGTIPAIDLTKEASWKTVAGETPDKTTHVATFTYNVDGDYTFDISYKDNAENAAPAVPQHKFTIDKTLPVIQSVVYDNNDSRNGNYFKADRVATITIVEHNFDATRVVNLGVATDDGTPVTFPAISAWTTVGDVHTATIHYSADALYTFDIDFKDMAGNNIADFAPEAFYVDKTLPTLVIDGVAADSANNDEGNIGFTITAADTNMDVFAPVVKAMVLDPETGAFVEKTINIGGAITGHNTATYRVANLIEDGVYYITCSVVDKAGNSFDTVVLKDVNGATFNERVTADKPLILFSVNRNGSTFYVDDEYTKNLALEGGSYYTQNVENDLLIKEFNPDSIQASDVTITVNGQTLEEGTDYERTASQNGGYTYLYTIFKSNFKGEGEYNIVIGSKDRATNEAFSDMKFGSIKFVVDRTAPVVTVTGLKTNGRYQVEKQKVTLTPTDDGGLITKLSVILTEKDGTVIKELVVLEGEALADALAKGFVEFDIDAKNSAQYVKIICEDKAGNKIGADGMGEVFSNVTITTNAFLIFWANPVARYSAIAAVVVLAAAVIFFIVLKKKKKGTEEAK